MMSDIPENIQRGLDQAERNEGEMFDPNIVDCIKFDTEDERLKAKKSMIEAIRRNRRHTDETFEESFNHLYPPPAPPKDTTFIAAVEAIGCRCCRYDNHKEKDRVLQLYTDSQEMISMLQHSLNCAKTEQQGEVYEVKAVRQHEDAMIVLVRAQQTVTTLNPCDRVRVAKVEVDDE